MTEKLMRNAEIRNISHFVCHTIWPGLDRDWIDVVDHPIIHDIINHIIQKASKRFYDFHLRPDSLIELVLINLLTTHSGILFDKFQNIGSKPFPVETSIDSLISQFMAVFIVFLLNGPSPFLFIQ